MKDVLYRARFVTVIAVVFSVIGGTLMFVAGAASTVRAIGKLFGTGDEDAFSDEATLRATVGLVSSLDEFLLGLVLLIFAFGIYRLFVVQEDIEGAPEWLAINSVTDLKIKLLETIAILLAVVFLKGAFEAATEPLRWEDLVLPISAGIFSASIWLIRRAD